MILSVRARTVNSGARRSLDLKQTPRQPGCTPMPCARQTPHGRRLALGPAPAPDRLLCGRPHPELRSDPPDFRQESLLGLRGGERRRGPGPAQRRRGLRTGTGLGRDRRVLLLTSGKTPHSLLNSPTCHQGHRAVYLLDEFTAWYRLNATHCLIPNSSGSTKIKERLP